MRKCKRKKCGFIFCFYFSVQPRKKKSINYIRGFLLVLVPEIWSRSHPPSVHLVAGRGRQTPRGHNTTQYEGEAGGKGCQEMDGCWWRWQGFYLYPFHVTFVTAPFVPSSLYTFSFLLARTLPLPLLLLQTVGGSSKRLYLYSSHLLLNLILHASSFHLAKTSSTSTFFTSRCWRHWERLYLFSLVLLNLILSTSSFLLAIASTFTLLLDLLHALCLSGCWWLWQRLTSILLTYSTSTVSPLSLWWRLHTAHKLHTSPRL